ncbi:2-iminoacetate synthase ThiH [Nitratidesulfovibrio sp. D1]|uniref:2-iminoacetate synthase ThiH n=1 Tax=Nitratidesulfovibrio sp. D1 TaxID=3440151 RepID=UPI003EBE4A21
MSMYDVVSEWTPRVADAPLREVMESATAADVARVLRKERLSPHDLPVLLSPAAATQLEAMARRARELTVRHFGRTIQLFTPLYLSNHCTNQCRYCGFNARNHIPRQRLSDAEIVAEGRAIAATGLRHLLLLTGDARHVSGPEYIAHAARLLAPYFPSLSVEVYSLTDDEYALLVDAGIDGMTMFQETYNKALYPELHPAGPKRDYRFRLDAPERAALAGMRAVGLGALLGLDDWRRDAFFTALHGHWLQRHYPYVDVSFSVPRLRPHAGAFQPAHAVSDRDLVQVILAYRIFMPSAGITVSTRERAELRDNLIPLGVTRMSAGVSTAVGGHAAHKGAEGQAGHAAPGDADAATPQFEISDPRSADAMAAAIAARGYQPVYKDWESVLDGGYGCGIACAARRTPPGAGASAVAIPLQELA